MNVVFFIFKESLFIMSHSCTRASSVFIFFDSRCLLYTFLAADTCMPLYVCMYVCGSVGVYVCGCVGMYECMWVGGCVYGCVCVGMYVCGSVGMCMGVWVCMWIGGCVYM